ncbi:MAG: septal ring lytic transglycosylase RlpA family protein [Proteobacteria bacterium]|uniref:septal ring lytic transglycosylase RlpA family protein n=1 Tax=Rudaea sp. TaxID=2136325 RepID=UPI00321FAAA8|nr:septal ring lytic transglycosylase RlpA family protein [Pseudomonadota bacterium]
MRISRTPCIKLCIALSSAAIALTCNAMLFAQGKPASAEATHRTASSSENQHGLAAVYSDRLNGRRTASGERYDRNALTAANPSYAFGTKVKVTNKKNGKSVVVRINDRGPVQKERVIDLSPAAAHQIGMGRMSTAEVDLEPVK